MLSKKARERKREGRRRKEEEGEGSCDSQILVISLPSAGSHLLSIPPSLMVLQGNYQVSTNSRYRICI